MLDLSIGLTDFCKVSWGVDSKIAKEHFDIAGFTRKVKRLKPHALAFTSKTAASLWLGLPTGRITTGRHIAVQLMRGHGLRERLSCLSTRVYSKNADISFAQLGAQPCAWAFFILARRYCEYKFRSLPQFRLNPNAVRLSCQG